MALLQAFCVCKHRYMVAVGGYLNQAAGGYSFVGGGGNNRAGGDPQNLCVGMFVLRVHIGRFCFNHRPCSAEP